MGNPEDLNDSWFDRPGRELRREQLPIPPKAAPPPEPAADDEPARDSLADPWFR